MRYLLDTNVCVVYLNGRSRAGRQRLRAADLEEVAVCSVVKAELFKGAMRSNNPSRTLAAQQLFLNRFPSLPFDDQAALIYSRIRAQLAFRGTPIGSNDQQNCCDRTQAAVRALSNYQLANPLYMYSRNPAKRYLTVNECAQDQLLAYLSMSTL